MTTTLHRIKVTETPTVADAIAEARRRWPDEARESRLIARALADWTETRRAEADARRTALHALAGKYPYPPNYLEDLRASDWPDDEYTAEEFKSGRGDR